jgi:hypothetical protein
MLKRSIIVVVACIMIAGCQKNTCNELKKAVDLKIDQTDFQQYKTLLQNCPDQKIREEEEHKVFTRGSFEPSPVKKW